MNVSVDHETLSFCDKLHNDLSLRTSHLDRNSKESRSNAKRQSDGESRSDGIKRVCQNPNIMEHVDTLLQLRSDILDAATLRSIKRSGCNQDTQTNHDVSVEFESNTVLAKEKLSESDTTSTGGKCDASANSSSEQAVPEEVGSNNSEFSNASLHDLEKCCEL